MKLQIACLELIAVQLAHHLRKGGIACEGPVLTEGRHIVSTEIAAGQGVDLTIPLIGSVGLHCPQHAVVVLKVTPTVASLITSRLPHTRKWLEGLTVCFELSLPADRELEIPIPVVGPFWVRLAS